MVTENGGSGAPPSAIRVATGKGRAPTASRESAALGALGTRQPRRDERGQGRAGRSPAGAGSRRGVQLGRARDFRLGVITASLSLSSALRGTAVLGTLYSSPAAQLWYSLAFANEPRFPGLDRERAARAAPPARSGGGQALRPSRHCAGTSAIRGNL